MSKKKHLIKFDESIKIADKLATEQQAKKKITDDQIQTMVDRVPNAPTLMRVAVLRAVNHAILEHVFGFKLRETPVEVVREWLGNGFPVDTVMGCPMFCFHPGCLDMAKEKMAEVGHIIEFNEIHAPWERALAILDVMKVSTKTFREDLVILDKKISEERNKKKK